MQHRTELAKKDLLAALKASRGIIADACHKADVNRNSYYRWLKEDFDFKTEAEEIMEEAIDFAEKKLFERMAGGKIITEITRETMHGDFKETRTVTLPPDTAALKWFLSRKGKKRGYILNQKEQLRDTYIPPVIHIHPQGEKPDEIRLIPNEE